MTLYFSQHPFGVLIIVLTICRISSFANASNENVNDAKAKRLKEYDEWKNSHLSWLTQSQASELDNIFKDGASNEDLFLKIFEFFDFEGLKNDSSSQLAVEQLRKGCIRFMKENAAFNSEPGFFEAVEEMFKYPFHEDSQKLLITKSNLLYSKIDNDDLKIFAQKFLPSCVKIIILDAFAKSKSDSGNHSENQQILAKHVKGLLENYEKWIDLYLSWMTEEQKNELNALRTNEVATVDDFRVIIMQIYGKNEGETLVKANRGLVLACNAFIEYLDKTPDHHHLEQFQAIRKTAADVHTIAEGKIFEEKISQRFKHEIIQLIAHMDDPIKQLLASKLLPTCHNIYVFNCRLIRTYHDSQNQEHYVIQDDDIDKWTNLYLSWLTKEQSTELHSTIEEGASIDELHSAVENYYNVADGVNFIKATESLNDGCVALLKYLADEDHLAIFKLFIEDVVERYSLNDDHLDDQDAHAGDDTTQLHEMKKTLADGAYEHVISMIQDSFKQNLAEKFIASCSYVFEASSRVRRISEHYNDNHEKQ